VGTAETLAFASDGKVLAVNDVLAYDIQLIDPAKAKIFRSISVKDSYGVLESMAVSPDGRTIATGGNDKVARLLGVATASSCKLSRSTARESRLSPFHLTGQCLPPATPKASSFGTLKA
jgi:WD40 repeat protein